jgi:alanine dehydrogenase
MRKKFRVLNRKEVEQILSMSEVLGLVEKAFEERGLKRVQMPPKAYLFFSKFGGDLRVMPAYLEGMDEAGVKLVNVHPNNPSKYGLPTVLATIVLFDPETGAPISIMDGTGITAMRTAAASGVAIKHLARKDARVLGIIGAGYQVPFQLEALNEVMKIEAVKIFDMIGGKADNLAARAREKFGLNVSKVAAAEEAVRGSDVVVTVTPTKTPIVHGEWVAKGMHINAIGADAPGKEELEAGILTRAKIVIDDWEQASHGGEINVPLSKKIITRANIYAEIAEIVAGAKQGRVSEDEITVFDLTGLAIQDVITAWRAYEVAEEKGIGQEIEPLYC